MSSVSSKLARDFPEVLRNNEGKGAFVASRGRMCERDNPREFGDRHLCQRPWVQGSQMFPHKEIRLRGRSIARLLLSPRAHLPHPHPESRVSHEEALASSTKA